MGFMMLLVKISPLIGWALLLQLGTADRDYFIQSWKLPWDAARNHCQVCFGELATLTAVNIHAIVQQLGSAHSGHWIGLRKELNATGVSPAMPWSRWANGEPLNFQNWYPGWPVLKPSVSSANCCSCACPAVNSSSYGNLSDLSDLSDLNVTAGCVVFLPGEPQMCETPAEGYVEDSCVAMLGFGAWVEKSCSDPLPFICHDDRFSSRVNVTNRTTDGATVAWRRASGAISHYRVEVSGGRPSTVDSQGDLTHRVVKLTAGTRYTVQVFPVKCKRDLNPQNVTFFTTPKRVTHLIVSEVTNSSVYLSWKKPEGNVSFYLVRAAGKEIRVTTAGAQVDGLTPGGSHTFTVLSGVQDESTWSEESHLTAFTKPGQVSNVKASENTNNSLLLTWTEPEGNFTGFLVKARNYTDGLLFEAELGEADRSVTVTGLPAGSRITLIVSALANSSLEGEGVTIFSYTAPGPVSNVSAAAEESRLTVTWTPAEGNYTSFTVDLLLEGKRVESGRVVKETRIQFAGLKNSAGYTVRIQAVSGHLEGPAVSAKFYTLPSPPSNARVTAATTDSITFQWQAPENIFRAEYGVSISSSFWGHSWSASVPGKTDHTFHSLKSASRYRLEVHTMGKDHNSSSTHCSGYTAPERVTHLMVSEVTESSVYLSWKKPEGNVSFYLVRAAGEEMEVTTNGTEVDGLMPGGSHTFTVLAGVPDKSRWSEESHLTAFTKPGQVSNVKASENTNNSLLLTWTEPDGNFTGFLVKARNDTDGLLFEAELGEAARSVRVTGLPMGSRITLVVSALANSSLEGEGVTIFSYTAPGPVSDVTADAEESRLTVKWTPAKGNYTSFTVDLLLEGKRVESGRVVTETVIQFAGLKNSAGYTVRIQAVSGHLEGPTVSAKFYTLPSPPSNARVTAATTDSITFQWQAPENISRAKYGVSISSSFWGHGWSASVSNWTNHTFHNLKSGSKYQLEVHTVGQHHNSSSTYCSGYTVTVETEISLSMLCSSVKSLHCDERTTQESVFNQLHENICKVFGDNIRWSLEDENKHAGVKDELMC